MNAIYPGSFDPPTRGHVSILNKALTMFDSVTILIAVNPKKDNFLSPQERKKLWEETIINGYVGGPLRAHVRISEDQYTAVVAKELKAPFIIRGLRDSSDLEQERVLAHVNKLLQPEIETIFLFPDYGLEYISSSTVRAVLAGKKNWSVSTIQQMVPIPVLEMLAEKFK